MTEVSEECRRIRTYLESVIESQRAELSSLHVYHNEEMSELRQSLAASQAEIEELKHQLLLHRSLVNKHHITAFNSTFAPSSFGDDSPRFFNHTPPSSPPLATVSSPFARPSAPPPEI